ncbi:MAG: hypothetical protein J6I36_06975 [Bacteroidaceae bacterium]|nr:hypothetical protein [Bacteroidaceae bacterium]
MKKKILFTLISVLLPLSLWAQESHWQFDFHEFEYDMTVYVNLKLDDELLTDWSNYEVAAFCGSECRGILTAEDILDTGSAKVGQLRVRSNSSSGETITFKVYDKTEQKEINVQDTKVTFKGDDKIGSASAPFTLDITQRYTPGDVNGDNRINVMDIQLIINKMFKRTLPANFVEAAADVNGDGRVNVMDIQLVINKMFNRQ